tara:strand:- start:265 stop:1770 length:1506 start_codon:yes stop_codon:yes gene_type:complete
MKLERPTYQKPLSMTGLGGGATSLSFGAVAGIPKEYWIAVLGKSTSGGSSTNTEGEDIAVDSLGNVYVTGRTYCTPSGVKAILIAKYSPTGTLEWQRFWGSTHSYGDEGRAITVDSSDNIYVAGLGYSGSTYHSAVILKYNSSGVLQWNRNFGQSSTEPNGIDFDNNGNIYVSGKGQYSNWQFVAKFNSSGTLQWHRGLASGTQGHTGRDIAVDRNNEAVYVVGNTPYFGFYRSYDILLAKYNFSGTIQWHRTVNSTSQGQDFPYGVAVDGQGYVYTTGMTYQASFTNPVHPQYGQFPSGSQDGFIIKWGSSGYVAAQKTFGGAGASDNGYGVVTDSQNNIYICGQSSAGLNYFSYGGNGVGTRGLIMKLTSPSYSSITSSWSNSFGDFSPGVYGSDESTRGIAVDHQRVAVYTVGWEEDTGPGNKNMVIAKLPADGTKTGTYNSPHFAYAADPYGGEIDSYSINLDYSPGYTDSDQNYGSSNPTVSNPTASLTSTTYVVP